MDIITIILIGVPSIVWLWLSFIGTVAVKCDNTLDPFQQNAQILVVWFFPFIGASLIIYLVNRHAPEAIPHYLIPGLFRNIVFEGSISKNKNRDDNEGAGIDLALSQKYQSHSDCGGSDGDGSD